MIISLFIHITVFVLYIGLTALLLLISYIWFKKLLLDPIQYLIETSPKTQKGTPNETTSPKRTHLQPRRHRHDRTL